MLSNPHLRRDLLKLAYLIGAVLGTTALFVITPALSGPTLFSIILTMILSPLAAALERRGNSRIRSIMILFATFGVTSTVFILWAARTAVKQWDSFQAKAPEYLALVVTQMKGLENHWKDLYPFLKNVNPTDSFLAWGHHTSDWFVDHGPALVGDLLTGAFIVPILTFVLLNEGRSIRSRFFQLVPNRFFEIAFLITNKIGTGLADYIRAKLLEAFLVGMMTTLGLAAIRAPYAIVLGAVAGITNIVPYLGPLLGAVPAILVATLDGSHHGLLLPVVLVYLIVNAVDTVVIFPLIVGKLVNLHPILLIAAVAVGQHYYGLVGMLISIPVASSLKVVLHEIYSAVYETRSIRSAIQVNNTHSLISD